ncbi:MAG: uracil-DNA glycosylase [Azoarcus sp.]|jgi:DNA polymerase|nr:uracil-DNA glycosylase [Azoarcus sp.]
MGLTPLWRLRATETEAAALPPREENARNIPEPIAIVNEAKQSDAASGLPRGFAPRNDGGGAVIASEAKHPPNRMDRHAPVPAATPEPAQETISASRIAMLDWPVLEETIRACRACALCKQREQAVPGVGDHNARWMFVGEGPGAEEDRRGEPFVGQAGKLLDRMLAAIGLERGKDVYIANAVKCRPPFNRTPEAAEIAACLPFLDRQIALIQPRLLIALGRPAAQALLGREISIAAARGKRFERSGLPVLVTYHPAYLLRNPLDKSKAWEDLCFARAFIEKPTPA